jgi:hypothetical protein
VEGLGCVEGKDRGHQFYGRLWGSVRAPIFTSPKRMDSALSLVALLLIGFAVYSLIRDRLFDSVDMEPFQGVSVPAPAPIVVREAPVYPERTITPSGPSAPNQAGGGGSGEIHYAPPTAVDPYAGAQESSEIPETLRHPERSYRPAPANQTVSLAEQAGLASGHAEGPAMSTEMIQNGGEFMAGVFANDGFDTSTFSAF